jgi:hypothetical protein
MSGANPDLTLSLTKGEASPDYALFANPKGKSAKPSATRLAKGRAVR